MFLAYDVQYIDSEKQATGVLVLAVWVVVQLICHVGFELLSWKLKGNDVWGWTINTQHY